MRGIDIRCVLIANEFPAGANETRVGVKLVGEGDVPEPND